MSHHSCSEDTSILKVATGVVLGIWAAKLIPILIVALAGLAGWLVYLICKRLAEAARFCVALCQAVDVWITRRYSARAASMFWVGLLGVVLVLVCVGGEAGYEQEPQTAQHAVSSSR